ncbi:hypothetical protein LJR098_002505 [Rhizobium sp. LjRoot98]|uniref:hypothetical protein n=1 Tax=unclassified Rhizobium TaxID=2613769 RepID=UPI0007151700|nr:hypothetical protein [Rhizobium sp. Root1204]KQV35259.1 hypothetical protein ASC96_29295 [Rhizobium sp. Root1204]
MPHGGLSQYEKRAQPCRKGMERLTLRYPGTKTLAERFIIVQIKGPAMNRIIYIVGLVVIVIAILSFFGLR